MVVDNDILADSRLEGLAGNVNVGSYLSANAADFVLLKVNKKLVARQARQAAYSAPRAECRPNRRHFGGAARIERGFSA
jgi:hypothetical protein